ncbi:glucose-6-phosphate dehydrogenase assembly protein OpcA [Angustibacter aerolatus]
MIVDLPGTTTAAVARELVDLRDAGGAIALGRVLTLVVVSDEAGAEEAIDAANEASREHPCRVIAVVQGDRRGDDRLDAQLRVGGDAGASEVIVLCLHGRLTKHGASTVTPLLLPDSPVVAWWPSNPPKVPSQDPIGRMAQRRITDAATARNPRRALADRRDGYAAGDTDLAWTRVTKWRGLLAAALDQPPYESVEQATVTGASDSASTDLLAAWLGDRLGCTLVRGRDGAGSGLHSVRLHRSGGSIDLVRSDGSVAVLVAPGQPDRRIPLPRRPLAECLAEELRRLDPDETYERTLRAGLDRLAAGRQVTARQAAAEGTGVQPGAAAAATTRAARRTTATAGAETASSSTQAQGTSASRGSASTRSATRTEAATGTRATGNKASGTRATNTEAATRTTAATGAKTVGRTTAPAGAAASKRTPRRRANGASS